MSDFKLPGEHVYKGMRMPGISPVNVLDRIADFDFRSDDVMIVTYPKSGTTWLQQITWLIMHEADIETSRNVLLTHRSPFLEAICMGNSWIDVLDGQKSPRVIKSHLPYSFFKKAIEGEGKPKFKTVVGMRNIRDALVSYYHFYKVNPYLGLFDQDFDAFFQLFMEKGLSRGDYFDQIVSWWENKDNPNIYFVKFEDMMKDPRTEILKIASFLKKTLNDAQLDAIVNETSFKAMQSSPMTNLLSACTIETNGRNFFRKGEVGDSENHFTKEQLDYVNGRCEKELAPLGLRFEYA